MCCLIHSMLKRSVLMAFCWLVHGEYIATHCIVWCILLEQGILKRVSKTRVINRLLFHGMYIVYIVLVVNERYRCCPIQAAVYRPSACPTWAFLGWISELAKVSTKYAQLCWVKLSPELILRYARPLHVIQLLLLAITAIHFVRVLFVKRLSI